MTAWRQHPEWGVVDRPMDGEHGGVLYAAHLANGAVHAISGPMAVVARAALSGVADGELLTRVAEDLGVPQDALDEHVLDEVLHELRGLGLLVPAD